MPQNHYPPIQDLEEYDRSLRQYRYQYEEGVQDREAEFTLIEIGEELLEQCNFLEEKLLVKKREHAEQIGSWRKETEKLKREIKVLKEEQDRRDKNGEPRADVDQDLDTLKAEKGSNEQTNNRKRKSCED